MNNSQIPPGNLLIIAHSIESLKSLNELLSFHGYQIKKARSVKGGIIAAQSMIPDLIILDLLLPDLDEYPILKILKQNQSTQDIPVILITALDEGIDKVNAFKQGVVDYITKPFYVEEVLIRIQNQITLNRQKNQLQQEIKRREKLELSLSESQTFLRSILNSSPSGITALNAIRDQGGNIIYFRCMVINPVLAKMVGNTPEKLVGKRVTKSFLNQFSPQLFHQFVQVIEADEQFEQDLYCEHPNCQEWYHLTVAKLGDGLSITVRDITERKEWEILLNQTSQNLYQQAISDPLTKIANRRAFDRGLEQEWNRAQRNQSPLSLILADVDYFKLYNDYYGHCAGDECLRKIANGIQVVLKRSTDIVARYGGEEFAIILPNTEREGAKKVAELIQLEIQKLQLHHPQSRVSELVTLSLGISTIIPQQIDSLAAFIKATDTALYQAKELGRNCVVINSGSKSPVKGYKQMSDS